MRLRMLGILLASAAALAFATVRPAFAGEDGADDQPAAHDDDGGSGKGDGGSGDHGGTTDRADPSTKTLPSHASATARNNAFGQQERDRLRVVGYRGRPFDRNNYCLKLMPVHPKPLCNLLACLNSV